MPGIPQRRIDVRVLIFFEKDENPVFLDKDHVATHRRVLDLPQIIKETRAELTRGDILAELPEEDI